MSWRYIWPTSVSVGVLGLVATDWPLEWSSGFWTDHPMAAGVVGSVAILVLTASVIDAIFRHRAQVLRRHVMFVAKDDLANQYNLTRRSLIQLAGCQNFDNRATRPVPPERSAQLKKILSRHFDPLFSGDHSHVSSRLDVLLSDPDWLVLANHHLQARQVAWRESLARWAPLMLGDNVLQPLLLAAAEHNRSISDIQVPIIALARDHQEPSPLIAAQVGVAWATLTDDCMGRMTELNAFVSLNMKYDLGSSESQPPVLL